MGAHARYPMWGTVAAVVAAVIVRLGLAWRPVADQLDPSVVTWGGSLCTAVVASGLTTLGLLPSIREVKAAVVPPAATLPAAVADAVVPPTSRPPGE